MKKYRYYVAMILLILGQVAWANHTAIEGGLRSGLALGLRSEYDLDNQWSVRFGLAGSTGDDLSFANTNPLVLFAGLDKYAFNLNRDLPLEVGVGVVVYSSDNSTAGPYLHAIVDNLNGDKALFAEAGIDFINGAKLQAQIGYNYY